MNIAVDVILAVIGLIVIVHHSVRGFVRSVFGLLKLALSLIITAVITPLLFADSDFVTRLLAYVLIFIAAYVILIVISIIVDKIFKLPVLKQANKLLGIIFGIICAYVILSVAAAFITVAAQLTDGQIFGMSQTELEASTFVYRFFNQNGILILLDKLL